MNPPSAESVSSLAADTRSGAAQIAERAADILLRRANAGEAPSLDAFRQEILITGWSLIQAKWAMAPLVNLVNLVLWQLEDCETLAELRQSVWVATEQFKRQLKHHKHQVAEETLNLLPDGSSVLTLSYSSTVRHALLYAQRAGRRFEVICAETQPILSGRDMAHDLASQGLTVRLIADSTIQTALRQARLVVVGADLLSGSGLVNTVGTRELAAAARHQQIPLYSLCSSEKFLPLGYPAPQSGVNWAAPSNDLTVGRTFDLTALEDLAGIVTEQGVLPPAAIEAWLAATKLHPALAAHAWVSAPTTPERLT